MIDRLCVLLVALAADRPPPRWQVPDRWAQPVRTLAASTVLAGAVLAGLALRTTQH